MTRRSNEVCWPQASDDMSIGEDAHFLGAPLDLLLNGALDGIRGPHTLAMVLGKAKDRQALGDIGVQCGSAFKNSPG